MSTLVIVAAIYIVIGFMCTTMVEPKSRPNDPVADTVFFVAIVFCWPWIIYKSLRG